MERVKKWMEGPEVVRAFKHRGRVEREGGRFAFRLLKKLLPSPCSCLARSNMAEWRERQTKEGHNVLPKGFLAFVESEVERMFPLGWDDSYVAAIGKYVPNSSACVERSSRKGGARAEIDLDDYLDKVTGVRSASLSPFKYTEVLTAGKLRALTIAPVDLNVLRPLHKIIFDRVSRQKWSLIGPPSPGKFRKAGFQFRGTPLLSGDYASATDNLDLRVSSCILGAILDRAESVPDRVKVFAMASLYPQVTVGDEVVDVKRGQMMGSLLSFPLLCLYNRISSLWALGRVPMLINGDDLVAETRHPERWFRLLPALGLEPERSKSGISRTRLEINSTPFVVRNRAAVICPTARVRVLAPRASTPMVGGDMSQFVAGFLGDVQTRAEDEFLKAKKAAICAGLSIGIPLSSLGFRGASATRALVRNGIVAFARRQAKALPGTCPLPSLSGVEQLHTVPVYGRSPDVAWASERTQTARAALLYGAVTMHRDTAVYVDEWWREARAAGIRRLRPVAVRRISKGWSVGNRSVFHGELMSRSNWFWRLSGRIENPAPSTLRVLFSQYTRIPVLVRLGISRAA